MATPHDLTSSLFSTAPPLIIPTTANQMPPPPPPPPRLQFLNSTASSSLPPPPPLPGFHPPTSLPTFPTINSQHSTRQPFFSPTLFAQSAIDPIIPINIPTPIKLTHTNFLVWQAQILPILHGYNFTKFLNLSPPPPTRTTSDDNLELNQDYLLWTCKDQLLLGWLRASLSESIQAQLSIRRIADELAFVGAPVSDDDLVLTAINGLGSDFNSFVAAITATNRQDTISFSDLTGMLLSHEALLRAQQTSSSSTLSTFPAAFATTSAPEFARNNNRFRNHVRQNYGRGNNSNGFKPTSGAGSQIGPSTPYRPHLPPSPILPFPPNSQNTST